ncbi:MAG: hypothetical protein HDT35_01140 [Clostridiales bacterium]|nr:hypothetical protein [Clostridiales bacterium]
MSDLFARIAIEDARVDPLGVKETIAMALEHLGGVRVLEVQLQEPEQTRMADGAFAQPKPRPKPSPPTPGGQAPARGSRRPQTAMECCFSCACYRSDRNQDAGGNWYWGVCGRTGKPVYDLKDRCGTWARLGG